MKSKKLNKKLILNKRTIATLDFVETKKVLAGYRCCTKGDSACTIVRPCSVVKTCDESDPV